MSLLPRLPRWLRAVLLGANLAAALAVLIVNWTSTFPNLIASWILTAAAVAVAVPGSAWLTRLFDRHQKHVAAEHEATRAHVADQLSRHAAAQSGQIAMIADQIATLRARFDPAAPSSVEGDTS